MPEYFAQPGNQPDALQGIQPEFCLHILEQSFLIKRRSANILGHSVQPFSYFRVIRLFTVCCSKHRLDHRFHTGKLTEVVHEPVHMLPDIIIIKKAAVIVGRDHQPALKQFSQAVNRSRIGSCISLIVINFVIPVLRVYGCIAYKGKI
ncbi:hypothetical protein D3C73_985000 [compost metagenome]